MTVRVNQDVRCSFENKKESWWVPVFVPGVEEILFPFKVEPPILGPTDN
jgi:hypothetical protein